MGKHSESPPHACAHWEVFAPAASRRTWIHVSESISGLPLSRPVPVLQGYIQPNLGRRPFIGLRVRCTLNSLIGRSLILGSARTIPGTLPYLVLASVSRAKCAFYFSDSLKAVCFKVFFFADNFNALGKQLKFSCLNHKKPIYSGYELLYVFYLKDVILIELICAIEIHLSRSNKLTD